MVKYPVVLIDKFCAIQHGFIVHIHSVLKHYDREVQEL